jgi:hypothetical protein
MILRSLVTFILAFLMFLGLERNTSLVSILLEAIGFTIVISAFDRFVLDRDDPLEQPESGQE